jgi:RimJ/RimL family protein N-acetyltransferase
LGVGAALLQVLLDWAKAEPDLERIELSVFAHNEGAIRLYRKLGFVEEARLLRAFKLADGSYYDEVMMVQWVK